MRPLAAALLALALAGCAHLEVGRPIDGGRVREILPGRTKKDDILAWFGEPLHRCPGPGGEIFVYRFMRGTAQQELVVSFSEDIVCVFKEE